MKPIEQLIKNQSSYLNRLQKLIGYKFADSQILTRALIHRSYIYEHPDLPKQDNETLEFVGDAVLDLVVASILFLKYPKMSEGDLTKLRSALVQESYLDIIAQEIDLGSFLLLGKGEENSGGRQKPSILSCAYEAVVGAVFIDSNYENARQVVEKHFSKHIDKVKKSFALGDAKSRLQELTQQEFNEAPTYVLDKAEGPDHDKTFTISVHFHGKVMATSSAKSKKAAEQRAAELAIAAWQD